MTIVFTISIALILGSCVLLSFALRRPGPELAQHVAGGLSITFLGFGQLVLAAVPAGNIQQGTAGLFVAVALWFMYLEWRLTAQQKRRDARIGPPLR